MIVAVCLWVSAPSHARSFTIYTFIPWQWHVEHGAQTRTPRMADYLRSLGFRTASVVYEANYFTDNQPDTVKIENVARKAESEGDALVSFDNEFGDRYHPDSVIPAMLEILRIYKASGKLPVGVYATVPQASYAWNPANVKPIAALNRQYRAVADAVDVFSPTLYNYDGHDFDKWKRSAQFNVDQAKAYGDKPIIPYISPYVMTGKNAGVTQVEEFGEQEMKDRLAVLYQLGVPGCIVWVHSRVAGADGRPLAFDAGHGWGKALVEFAQAHSQ
jgi:hypothetical protein